MAGDSIRKEGNILNLAGYFPSFFYGISNN